MPKGKADIENGWFKVANELIEAFARTDFSGADLRVILAILRKTYGYRDNDGKPKKVDVISVSQLQEMTQLSEASVRRAFRRLRAANILITPVKIDRGKPLTLGINPHYGQWKPLSKLTPLSRLTETPVKIDRKPLSKLTPTKDKERHTTKDKCRTARVRRSKVETPDEQLLKKTVNWVLKQAYPRGYQDLHQVEPKLAFARDGKIAKRITRYLLSGIRKAAPRAPLEAIERELRAEWEDLLHEFFTEDPRDWAIANYSYTFPALARLSDRYIERNGYVWAGRRTELCERECTA